MKELMLKLILVEGVLVEVEVGSEEIVVGTEADEVLMEEVLEVIEGVLVEVGIEKKVEVMILVEVDEVLVEVGEVEAVEVEMGFGGVGADEKVLAVLEGDLFGEDKGLDCSCFETAFSKFLHTPSLVM